MSELWKRKIATYFARRDCNDDGVISKKDVEVAADRLADAENVSQEERAEIKEGLVEVWQAFMKSAGSDDNGLLTPSIAIASAEEQKDDPAFKELIRRAYRNTFLRLDVNRDGFVSPEELARGYAAAGLHDTSFVQSAFEYMDLNKDGKLSLDEFASAMLKYLTTEDEFPLFGPLI